MFPLRSLNILVMFITTVLKSLSAKSIISWCGGVRGPVHIDFSSLGYDLSSIIRKILCSPTNSYLDARYCESYVVKF